MSGKTTGAALSMEPERCVNAIMTRRLAIYVAALAILVVYFLIWPVWRAQFLIEIWPTEAWNAYFQDAAKKDPQPEIHVSPNRLAKYDAVARVLADAQRLGATHIGFSGIDQYN